MIDHKMGWGGERSERSSCIVRRAKQSRRGCGPCGLAQRAQRAISDQSINKIGSDHKMKIKGRRIREYGNGIELEMECGEWNSDQ